MPLSPFYISRADICDSDKRITDYFQGKRRMEKINKQIRKWSFSTLLQFFLFSISQPPN